MVVRGFAQREGFEFFETFSHYPSVTSIRLLTALAYEVGLGLCNFDAVRAFVRSELKETVLVRPKQSCGAPSGTLSKPLPRKADIADVAPAFDGGYELSWVRTVRSVEKGANTMIVVVHVNDIFSIGPKSWCEEFGRGSHEYVPVSHLGELRLYAGIRFSCDFAFLRDGYAFLADIAENSVAKFGVTRKKDTLILCDPG